MNIQVGTYTGNGTDNRAITGVGFAPDLVLIKAGSTASAIWRSTTIVGDNSFLLHESLNLQPDEIQSLDSDGFTLGTSARVNGNGTTYYWVAFREATANFQEASYTGNGVDNRSITGVGFQPAFVYIKSNGNQGYFRTNEQSGDDTIQFANTSPPSVTDTIQAFQTDGFQIGSSTRANQNGTVYYYWAFLEVGANFQIGSYTGNGSDARAITGVGFSPDVLIIKRFSGSTGVGAAYRTSNVSGDNAFILPGSNTGSNIIESLNSDGFTVGTDTSVNENGVTYHWLAWNADVSGTTTSTTTSTSTSTTSTSSSTSTTSTSSSTTRTTSSTSTTSTSTSTTSTSTSTSTTTSTSSSTSTTSTSTTTTVNFVYSIDEGI